MALAAGSLCLVGLMLSGCSILPAGAPTTSEVIRPQNASDASGTGNEYALVDLSPAVLSVLADLGTESFSGSFVVQPPPADLRLGIGDTVQVSIWEAGGSGLFGPAASAGAGGGAAGGAGVSAGLTGAGAGAHGAPLQPMIVGRDGHIFVPFAGRIRALGLTVEQLRSRIQRALAGKAIEPQVQVALVGNASNAVTVGGEVNRSAVVPLNLRGDRLLDAIAAAGGAKFAASETSVRVTRQGRTATVSLQNIVDRPRENIYLRPGDSIYVMRTQRTFTAFGATKSAGHIPFDTQTLNLAEAVAKAGGLVDAQSDPNGVFVFRYESARTYARLVPGATPWHEQRVPVIYHVNLREANGYFHARQFAMRDKDVILIANADGVQLLKFMTLARGVTGIVSDIKSVSVKTSSSSSSTGF